MSDLNMSEVSAMFGAESKPDTVIVHEKQFIDALFDEYGSDPADYFCDPVVSSDDAMPIIEAVKSAARAELVEQIAQLEADKAELVDALSLMVGGVRSMIVLNDDLKIAVETLQKHKG